MRLTKSSRARSTAREYVRSPLRRTASSKSCSLSTRFVRFMHIGCVTTEPAVKRQILIDSGAAPRARHSPLVGVLCQYGMGEQGVTTSSSRASR
jgi:hypothetical protein